MQVVESYVESSGRLSISVAPKLLDKLLNIQGGRNIDGLATLLAQKVTLPEVAEFVATRLPLVSKATLQSIAGKNPPLDASTLARELKRLAQQPGALEDFALTFAEALFLSGNIKPPRLLNETCRVLREVGEQLVCLRQLPDKDCAPRGRHKLDELRKLDRQLLDFAAHTEGIRAVDYVALNDQHRIISAAVYFEEQAYFKHIPQRIRSKLEMKGLLRAEELESWGVKAASHVRKLLALAIIEEAEIPGVGKVLAYAPAQITPEHFEAVIPTRILDLICQELEKEFYTKYGGRYRPLGIAENRERQVPTLSDRLRLEGVAKRSQVASAHVILTLKYLAQHGLIENDHTGFKLSARGASAGLGINAVRFVQRARQQGEEPPATLSLDRYLAAAKQAKAAWKLPTYRFETSDGGAPWVYLIDEMYAGNARFDGDMLAAVLQEIKQCSQALVVASNMLQGDPAVEPRAARTSVSGSQTAGVDYRDYDTQLALVRELLIGLGHPALLIHGKNDIETANLKADVQRERDLRMRQGEQRPDERMIKAALSRLNEITHRAGRKYNAKLQAEILQFIANVVMPLELKLGRELMNSHEIRTKTGLNINELEIVRDIATELLEDRRTGTAAGRTRAETRWADFLRLPEAGAGYVQLLEEALFPEDEMLVPGKVIARGGAIVQLTTPSGAEGLKMLFVPEARFGLAELINPTEKLIKLIKSRTLAGRNVPDIIVTGATGESYVSMTAGGTLVIAGGSLQSSDGDVSFLYSEAQDRHKRRRYVRGGEVHPGIIAFSGGVTDGRKTDAYTLRLWNPKIQAVLEANASAGLPSCNVDIYCTSDLQTGSPTSKPATWLRGLFWAIANGQKEILINGDLFQGQNYGRAPAEMQLTGLIGIEDQQAFVFALLNPVLDLIKDIKRADPAWEIPRFSILAGNHETNSQAGKGLQGIWFLQTVAAQIESFYRGAFGAAVAEKLVLYPKKFVDRSGVDVDYAHLVLDFTATTGFRIGAQHYVGTGTKGSTCAPPVASAKTWGLAMENELRPLHGFLLGHWHTQAVAQAHGMFYVIFGANADKSGFEWHLGYPTTVPASGQLRLFSDRPPEIFFVTDPYLRAEEVKLMKLPRYAQLISRYGTLEEFVETERARHQRRNQKAFSYGELELARSPHGFLDPHRRIVA